MKSIDPDPVMLQKVLSLKDKNPKVQKMNKKKKKLNFLK